MLVEPAFDREVCDYCLHGLPFFGFVLYVNKVFWFCALAGT